MKETRRSRRLEKKTKRNIVLSLLGILIIFVFMIKLGIPLMANFAIFVSGFKSTNEVKNNDNAFIQPPVLDPIPSATNSAEIQITGKSVNNSKVQLFINDQLMNDTSTDGNGNFRFTKSLSLGDNQIKTRVEVGGKQSSFSDTATVTYKNSAPSIIIDSPPDGGVFSKDNKSVNVTGKIDGGASVTVNGFWAIVDENNNFSYTLPLQNGDNEIKVVVTDQAGNKSEKTIKVKYSE